MNSGITEPPTESVEVSGQKDRHPIMRCGCAAQGMCSAMDGEIFDPPIPSCVVHDCIEVAENAPLLTGRLAKCGCGVTKPSSAALAFFEFLGEGAPDSSNRCKCGYYEVAHRPGTHIKCRTFIPVGAREFDKFYCGCRGWD